MFNKRLKQIAFLGIMMATLGVSVFSNQPELGRMVTFAGLIILLVLRVVLWRRKQRVP